MGLLDIAKGVAGLSPFGALASGVYDNTIGAANNMPHLQTAELDQGTKDLVNQRQALADKSPEQIAAERTSGINRSNDLGAIQGGMGIQNAGLMNGQPQSVQDALNRRANKGYAQSLSKIQNQARLDAVQEKAKARQQVLQARMQEAQSKANIMHAQDMEQFNNRAARNNALSSLLGTGMGIAGAAFGVPGAGNLAPKQQKLEMGQGTDMGGGSYQDTSGIA